MARSTNSTISTSIDGTVVTWRDEKRRSWAHALVVPLLPFLAWLGVFATGLDLFWYTGPFWILIGLPIVDTLVGIDRGNPPPWAESALENDRYYRVLTYCYLPLQYAGFFWGAWLISRGHLSLFAELGLALTVGAVGGIGIANAHELGHKTDSFERWMAKLVLAQTAYGHFRVEHNRGHHVRVATPEDPASARMGESFWAFLPRSVIGAACSGWRIEKNRLARKGSSPWSVHNEVVTAWLMSVVLFSATIAIFGVRVVPYLVVQAVFGFSLLEVVNYIEHYGLLRQKDANGKYERCAPRHSWNSDHIASNLVLYGLERHADHHANPTRRYQTLRTFDEAPQLPSGYGTMIGLAYLTPLWRQVMDKRVLALYGGDVTLANLDPRKRQRLLTKFGAKV